jgi:hypothetical protein
MAAAQSLLPYTVPRVAPRPSAAAPTPVWSDDGQLIEVEGKLVEETPPPGVHISVVAVPSGWYLSTDGRTLTRWHQEPELIVDNSIAKADAAEMERELDAGLHDPGQDDLGPA